MADLIDRQTAIETAIEAADKWDGGYSSEREGIIRKFFDKVPAAQPDHVADIGKKVSISCGQENDVIFRQAAIDALARMMPRSYTSDGSHPADEEIFRVQEVFVDCIEALEILPSAQPATNCSEIPNGSDDTISRQAVIALAKDICVPTGDGGVYRTRSIDPQEVRELPAVQPEIVRCKDCKHRHVENMVWTCPFGLPGGENFFCGYGTEPYKGK